MSSNLELLWNRCLKLIKEELNDDLIYDNFFAESYLESIDDGIANIVVNSIIAKSSLETNTDLVEECISKVTETNFIPKFWTKDEIDSLSCPVNFEESSYVFQDKLNKNYDFENFVVGLSNKESYHAAISVSNKPGTLFNPLFIYGKSGLGKTHLIHSIGNRIKNQFPNMRVLYVSSEEFFNDYITIVKSNTAKDDEWFNHKYRDVDVLIVDDIQFLKNKEKSNEMFFNVYNDLFSKNKQIIITSDVMPKELRGLEERLVSRFSQGLSVSITPPEFETRLRILKNKLSYFSEDEASMITDDALEYIAGHFTSDVRDLEGALNRIFFYSINMLNLKKINMNTVYEAFKDYQSLNIDGDVTNEKILKTVCEYYNLSKTQIVSKSRQKLVATPRQVAIYLTRTMLETPYEKIGKLYGNRDHSTIMSSYHKVKDQIEANNNEYIHVIDELTKLLKS